MRHDHTSDSSITRTSAWVLVLLLAAGLVGLCDAAFASHRENWRTTQSLVGGMGFVLVAVASYAASVGSRRQWLFLAAAAALLTAGTMRFWH